MVSQYTWPNFHGGPDRDGVRIIIQQQNFEEDVVYGRTKIFVRSPQTLFMLEQVTTTTIAMSIFILFIFQTTFFCLFYQLRYCRLVQD
jgi:myosin-1